MAKHQFDIEDEKESIKRSIRRISNLIGKTPTQKDYKTHRDSEELSLEQITYRFGNWSDAIKYAGLEPNPFQQPPRSPEITREALIDEFIKVANEIGRVPGTLLFRSKAKFSWMPYKTNWGSWRAAVEDITQSYSNRFEFDVEAKEKTKNLKNRKKLHLNIPLIFEPINEMETIILFSFFANDMGYKIKEVKSEFPDAILEKDGRDIRVEFEFLSSNYLQHCHSLDFEGICICWRKDLDIPNIEILSLEEYIRGKYKK